MGNGQKWRSEKIERNSIKIQRTWFLPCLIEASCRWEERKSCKKSQLNTCCYESS